MILTITKHQQWIITQLSNKEKDNVKKDIWIQLNRIIRTETQVVTKNTLIMDLMFTKIRRNIMMKEEFHKINKEKEVTLFMIFERLQIKSKSKVFYNISLILTILCRI